MKMMKTRLRLTVVAVLSAGALACMGTRDALAHGTQTHDAPAMRAGRDASKAELHIAPEAVDAVAAVERFSDALGAGDLSKASAELDPDVIILESGGAERSRDEYLSGHAKDDADFLKTAMQTLKRRSAQASADLAWVASESAIHTMKGEEMLMLEATETMVLRKSSEGWKIVHIHWSSHRAGGAH